MAVVLVYTLGSFWLPLYGLGYVQLPRPLPILLPLIPIDGDFLHRDNFIVSDDGDRERFS